MPIYVYQCADCDTQIEKRQGFADAPLTTCERCGGSLRRVLQPVGIIFKGSGFYSTDHRAASEGKKDGAAGEAKPASSTESGAASGGTSSGESSGESKNGTGEKPAASTSTNGTTTAPATKSTSSTSTKSSDTNS
jgi:putative FmdB family regulatory protein